MTQTGHHVTGMQPESSAAIPAPAVGGDTGRKFLLLLFAILVAAAVLYTYWPVFRTHAVSFDDEQYWVTNRLVRNPSWDSLSRFFGEVLRPSTVRGYYQPLTMTSLMVDSALGGRLDNMVPFHRTGLGLHVLNTMLVMVLLYLLFGNPWIAALVGLLFGTHPLTVEPIPWVSERKTLLAAFFSLWCLILYVHYARKSRGPAYGLALAAFVLALLAKPTATPMPVLLLLLDFWPLRRLSWRAVREKIPFLVVAVISGVITFFSQRLTAGAEVLPQNYPNQVSLTLLHNIVFYPYRIIWPHNLTAHYGFPEWGMWQHPWQYQMFRAGIIGTLVLIPLLLISLRWTRSVFTGWLFFLVAIFPTMGLVGFTNVIASDKFVYLPVTGLLMILAFGLGKIWGRSACAPGWLAVRALAVVIALGLAGAEAHATRAYLEKWKDVETLCRHMLTLDPKADGILDALGRELYRQGRREEAAEQFKAAVAANPISSDAHNNLGMFLADQGKFAEALPYFAESVRLNPNYAPALGNLGRALMNSDPNNAEDALRCFERALQLDPYAVDVYNSMGVLYGMQGKWDQSEKQFREAMRLSPNLVNPCLGLGRVFLEQNKNDDAIRTLEAAERLAPQDPRVRKLLDYARSRVAPASQP